MKTTENRKKAREIADRLQAAQSEKGGRFTDWFEELYARADGNAELIPWGNEKPHSSLVQWVKTHQPGENVRALDVGCGLGDNAAFLAENGWQVTGIDLSPSAVKWAARRFDNPAVCFREVDLFCLPDDLKGRFGLVHETYTLQALPRQMRSQAFEAIASLLAPEGRLLVICRSRAEHMVPDGPPWPLAKSELEYFVELGLSEVSLQEFEEQKPDGRIIPHIRAEFKKSC